LNPQARITAGNEPVHSGTCEDGVDAGAVEIDRGSWPETSGPSCCSGDLYRLLDGFRIQMQQRRIDVWIQSSLREFRLSNLMPAFVLHVDLNCRVCRQLVLP